MVGSYLSSYGTMRYALVLQLRWVVLTNIKIFYPMVEQPAEFLCPIQWWLRFKRGMCHAKETSLKHDPLLIRFKRGFLLNRDPGLRETSLRPDYMGFKVYVF